MFCYKLSGIRTSSVRSIFRSCDAVYSNHGSPYSLILIFSSVPCLFFFYYSTLYFTSQRYSDLLRLSSFSRFFLVEQGENSTFRAVFSKNSKPKGCYRYIGGTTEQLCLSFPLSLNYISSPFRILGRIAQYYFIDKVSTIATRWRNYVRTNLIPPTGI